MVSSSSTPSFHHHFQMRTPATDPHFCKSIKSDPAGAAWQTSCQAVSNTGRVISSVIAIHSLPDTCIKFNAFFAFSTFAATSSVATGTVQPYPRTAELTACARQDSDYFRGMCHPASFKQTLRPQNVNTLSRCHRGGPRCTPAVVYVYSSVFI